MKSPTIWFHAPELFEWSAQVERRASRRTVVLAYDRDHARRQAAVRLGVPPDRIEVACTEARLESREVA